MRNKNELKLFTMSKEVEKSFDSFISVFKILIVLALVDVISTIIFLYLGYSESMLMAIKFMNTFGIIGLILQKVILLILVFVFVFGIYVISEPMGLALVYLMTIGQLFIIVSNVILILVGTSLIEILGGIL